MTSNHASGSVFNKLFNTIQEDHGEDVFPIVLDLNYDSITVDLIGKNHLKPLKMKVKNVGDHVVELEEKIFTVACGAIFHHIKNEMKKFLKAAWILGKSKRTEALKYLNR
jgi:hypothetical protein